MSMMNKCIEELKLEGYINIPNELSNVMSDFNYPLSHIEIHITCVKQEEAEKLVANGFFIKMSETKDVYHEMGVASTYNPANNDKYVSVDGHIEGVYDENGNRVTDSVNQGTYNFANPNKDPIGHFTKDVIPYYIWGNSPDDPTSFWERVTGTYSGNVDGE